MKFDINKALNKGHGNDESINAVCNQIDTDINDTAVGGNKGLSKLGHAVMVGESFSAVEAAFSSSNNQDATTVINDAIATLESSEAVAMLFNGDSNEEFKLSDAQKASVAIAVMAHASPKEFGKAIDSMGRVDLHDDNAIATDTAGYQPVHTFNNSSEVLAGESFENVSLTGTYSVNIIAAARQAKLSPFAEMFCPTVAVPPSKTTVALNVRVPMIENPGDHALSGAIYERQRRSLVEARYDSSILENKATKVQAVYRDSGDDNDTTAFLAPASEIAPVEIEHNGAKVKISPIKTGVEVDLLGLNSTDGLSGVTETQNSMLTKSGKVGILYLRLEKGSDVEILPINVADVPGFRFTRGNNQSNDKTGMVLNFNTKQLPFASKKDGELTYTLADGSDSTLLSGLVAAKLAANLKIHASGSTNLEYGNTLVTVPVVEVSDAANEAGDRVLPSDPTLAAALSGIEMSIAYWYPDMSVTNTNWQRAGKFVAYNELTFPYSIATLAPFTLLEPTDAENSAQSVTELASAVTQQASNNVALAVLNYAELVERASMSFTAFQDEVGTLGAGSVLINRPYYKKVTLDCVNDINSTETEEKRSDFRALFLDTVRNEVAIADMIAGVQGGIDANTANSGKKAKAHIATDPLLEQHLFESGEPRTVGNYPFQIESCDLKEWRGRCLIMLGQEGGAGENPMAVGQRWMVPDLLREATISGRDTVKRTMIVPRYTIAFNVPVVIDIEVLNLPELFSSATYTYVSGKDGAPVQFEDVAASSGTGTGGTGTGGTGTGS